jgi:hypothetical protein
VGRYRALEPAVRAWKAQLEIEASAQVSIEDASDRRFLRGYRLTVLGAAVAWRTVLAVGLSLPDETGSFASAVVVLYGWGLLPYLALAGVAGKVYHRGLLVTSSVLLFAGDVLSGVGVLRPGSSTDAVALFTVPLFATFGFVPVVWLVGKLLNR